MLWKNIKNIKTQKENQENMGQKLFMIPMPLKGIFLQLEKIVVSRQLKTVLLLMWINRTMVKFYFNDLATHTSQNNGPLQL